jgi:hypothetical protein
MALVTEPGERNLVPLAAGVSLFLCALRLSVAHGMGFGDAEALYAAYALHPQPAYVEHPGLIGSLARLLGRGNAPTPALAHFATAILATLLPWAGALAARASGATWRGAMLTVLALALTPELSVGLFGLTPDLPLAFAWILALGSTALALRSEPGSRRALAALLGAGVFAGIACLSKASGVLLVGTIFLALLTRPRFWLTLAPWSAVGVIAILVTPVVIWEVRHGYPMLRHRLITSQVDAGLSLRNLGMLIGGQLAYVTPPFLVAAGIAAWDLHKKRKEDPVFRLFWLAVLLPGTVLVLLCLWSRVAEPHWVAPAYLPLALYVSRTSVGKRIGTACIVVGFVIVLFVFAWVKTPLPMTLLASKYRPRYDVSNDLYAWGPGKKLVREAVAAVSMEFGQLPVVVGPHYVVCAQAHAALGNTAPVGCNTPRRDDFDFWFPRSRWIEAPFIVYVHDSRFTVDPERELPNRIVRGRSHVDVVRGGITVRTIWVTILEKGSEVGLRPAEQREDLPLR